MKNVYRWLPLFLFLLISPELLQGGPLYQGVMNIDGKTVYIAVHGDDERKPAMVCLPFGPGSSSRYLEESLPPLFDKVLRLVFIDYYYSGRSVPSGRPLIYDRQPVEGISPADQADLILSLMTTLGMEKFGILGHDFGAFVGARLLRKAPRRILFFAGVSPRLDYPGELSFLTEKLYETFERSADENSVSGLKALEQKTRLLSLRGVKRLSPEEAETLFSLLGRVPELYFYQPVDKKTQKTVRKLLRTGTFLPLHSAKDMLPYLYSSSYYNSDETIPGETSSIPVLLLQGERDPWFKSSGDEMEKGSACETIPHSAFFPMLENPGAFKAALLDFLRLHHIIDR